MRGGKRGLRASWPPSDLVERRPLRPPTSRENPAAEGGRRSTDSTLSPERCHRTRFRPRRTSHRAPRVRAGPMSGSGGAAAASAADLSRESGGRGRPPLHRFVVEPGEVLAHPLSLAPHESSCSARERGADERIWWSGGRSRPPTSRENPAAEGGRRSTDSSLSPGGVSAPACVRGARAILLRA